MNDDYYRKPELCVEDCSPLMYSVLVKINKKPKQVKENDKN